ncbi:TetR/AcrR family transcriptional regulator [Novosphingobium sp.]|uniref:TetR/AcrR family transcriptional regulator n=1 Tax=Novosphingobium sp. TaxID=1874826 RepID=UPI00286E8AE3|nr:TetR/AcrR family transcriptional regulator [Novosphingobium sp.]
MHSSRAKERMSKPDDARALRSRQALRNGLLDLLGERPLHEITIRDITGRAGVSYPVFFRRYGSKEELLAEVAAEEVRNLMARTYPVLEAEGPDASLGAICAHIQANRALWTSLLTTGAAPAMREEFARLSAEYGVTGPRANPWLPVPLASAFVSAGIFEILVWWLAQPEDYPVQNVIAFLNHLVVQPTIFAKEIKLI